MNDDVSARYRSLHRSLGAVVRAYTRLEVSGVEHIPQTGGAIVCPRHENLSDPFLVAAALPEARPLQFLAWEGVFGIPVVGRWIKSLGVVHTAKVQLGRANDVGNIRATMIRLHEIVAGGHLVTIFPEGNINHWIGPGGIKPFRSGAVRLAARAGVPILPVGTSGTRWVIPSFLNLHDFGGPDFAVWIPIALPMKVRVRFGPLFVVDPRAAQHSQVAEQETERLRAVVAGLSAELGDHGARLLPTTTRPRSASSSESETRR
jgi:1-acyl-sn-glycerol-3-phosphate acyltransferase